MLIDARSLPEGHRLEVDLCIVGSGPAGLTLAQELRNTPLSICIVESGPEQPDARYEALNETLASGSDLDAPVDARARALGGSAHRWQRYPGGFGRGLRLLPFSPIDFEARSWVPDSGWPFGAEDLQPFERRARRVAGIPSNLSDATEVATTERPLLPLDPEQVRTTLEWFVSPRRLREQLPRAIARRDRATVLTHATAMSISMRDSSIAVDGVDLRTIDGRRLSVGADRVVLATGGIENARLLLESRDRHPDGIGNHHDRVGRYYMDHLKLIVADVVPADRTLFDRMGFYDLHRHGDAVASGKLQLTAEAQRARGVLNSAVRFEPRPSAEAVETTLAVRRLASDVRRRRWPGASIREVVSHPRSWPGLGALGLELGARQRSLIPSPTLGWSQLARPSRHFEKFLLEIQLELAPNPANRVTLSDHRNELGQRLPSVSWRWDELERRTIDETIRGLNQAFAAANLGSVSLRSEEAFQSLSPAGDNHPTGTTRMHRDPAHGVVNEEGRVHGIENLYVTGSSVFPTAGYANPTLSIMTLAARLADHLARVD